MTTLCYHKCLSFNKMLYNKLCTHDTCSIVEIFQLRIGRKLHVFFSLDKFVFNITCTYTNYIGYTFYEPRFTRDFNIIDNK